MTPTYTKHDRVTVNMGSGKQQTVTITGRTVHDHMYRAVTSIGCRILVHQDDIVGLA